MRARRAPRSARPIRARASTDGVRPNRRLLHARPPGRRPHAHPLSRQLRRAQAGGTRSGLHAALGFRRARSLLRLRCRTWSLRIFGKTLSLPPGARHRAEHARMEQGSRSHDGAPARSHEGTPLSGDPQGALRQLLPDGPPPRRGKELVHAAHRGAPAPDGLARHDRAPLGRQGAPDHHRLHRLRRLGVGRGPVRRRPARLQAPDLRNAL